MESALPIAELIPIMAIGLASIAGAIGLFEALLDLRAKGLARDVLSRKVASDPVLQQLTNQTTPPNEVDIETASKAIFRALGDELSDSDRKRVEKGLQQASKTSEWRYITMLF